MSGQNPKVFRVIEVENQEEGWLVGGLAFETIKVNDHLSLSETKQGNLALSFRVATIIFYGREWDEINRGDKARLLLLGGQDNLLQEAKYLYRLD
jgi:hypothetical protein